MILVDTSIWVDHLRRADDELIGLLEDGRVACHPFVTGELACGHLRNRAEILELLAALPQAPAASHDEVLHLVDRENLAGCGIGWIDAHLLAAAHLMGGRLWTRDRALSEAASRLGVG